jgi:O-antigen/teichoic acid export membrane protein
MASAWCARSVQAILTVLMLPILTSLLDANDYSVFILLSALVVWYMLADMGLGYVLQNKISEYNVSDLKFDAVIANVFFVGVFLGVILCALAYLLSFIVVPVYLSEFSTKNNNWHLEFVLTSFFLVFISIFGMVYKVWYATGKGYLSNIFPAISTIVSFCALFFIDGMGRSIELWHVLVIYFFPLMVFPAFFYIRLLLSLMSRVSRPIEWFLKLFPSAKRFLLFAFMSALVLNVDYFIASNYLSSLEIIKYNSLMKLFGFAFFIYSAFLMAIWPVISEMIAEKKSSLVMQRLIAPLVAGASIILMFSVVMVFFGDRILKLLLNNADISLESGLIYLFSIYFVLRVWVDTFSMIIKSSNLVSPLLKIVPVQAALSISMQIIFVKIYGVNGIVGGLILSILLTVAWYLPRAAMSFLSRNQGHVL